jgi:hypothetical protein
MAPNSCVKLDPAARYSSQPSFKKIVNIAVSPASFDAAIHAMRTNNDPGGAIAEVMPYVDGANHQESRRGPFLSENSSQKMTNI